MRPWRGFPIEVEGERLVAAQIIQVPRRRIVAVRFIVQLSCWMVAPPIPFSPWMHLRPLPY